MGAETMSFTGEKIRVLLNQAMGKTLKQVDSKNLFGRYAAHPNKVVKGIPGDIIEQSVLGMPKDSRQAPDIYIDGVETELKVTGVRKKYGKYIAKERLTITGVSPTGIANESFLSSHLWHKLRNVLIVYYLYGNERAISTADYESYKYLKYAWLKFSDDESEIIQSDWEKIRDFYASDRGKEVLSQLNQGKEILGEKVFSAYRKELSEGLGKLLYLEVAPKHPRARIALKNSYFKVKTHEIFKKKPAAYSLDQVSSYEDVLAYVRDKTAHYIDRSIGDISQELGVNLNTSGQGIAKNAADKLLGAILSGKQINATSIEEFQKAGFVVKNLVVSSKGGRTEDTKIIPVDLSEFETSPEMEFEASILYEYFTQSIFMFAIFRETESANYLDNVFSGVKILNFDEDFIYSEVGRMWNEFNRLYRNNEIKTWPAFNKKGEPIMNRNGLQRQYNNLPKSKDFDAFVRGTGGDSSDRENGIIINGHYFYRQLNYWLKGAALVTLLDSVEFI